MEQPKYEISIGLEKGTYNILRDGKNIFTVSLLTNGFIHIETETEVYDGPIELLSFDPDIKKV